VSDRRRPIVLTCTRGAEAVLAAELEAILPDPAEAGLEQLRGAVQFSGTIEEAYRACLWSRIGSRVLVQLASFDCPTADALYEGVRSLHWKDHLGTRDSLAVTFVGTSMAIRNSRFGALRVKDAVVDSLRGEGGERPSVNLDQPDVRIHVRLADATATVAIDLSGNALHRRGNGGRVAGPAPLKENLAATLIHLSGWLDRADDGVPLVDPMCGSGTLLTEAGGMALDRAPGRGRQRWGFTHWRPHDPERWERLLEEADDRAAAAAGRRPLIYGADIHPEAMDATLKNGLALNLKFKLACQDFLRSDPPGSDGPGVIVTNPPYGERLGDSDDMPALYASIGDVLKRRWPGWSAWILAGDLTLAKRFGLRPTRKIEIFNGPLDCRFVHLEIGAAATGTDGPGWRPKTDDPAPPVAPLQPVAPVAPVED